MLHHIGGWIQYQGPLIWTYIYPMQWQLQIYSHQLEIEIDRYAQIPLEERICRLCHQGVESEEQYVCHCTTLYDFWL